MFFYHYFEKSIGAFNNLSDLPANKAEEVIRNIRNYRPSSQAAQRDINYMKRRFNYEKIVRNLFVEKGGKPRIQASGYVVVRYGMFIPYLSIAYYKHLHIQSNCGKGWNYE